LVIAKSSATPNVPDVKACQPNGANSGGPVLTSDGEVEDGDGDDLQDHGQREHLRGELDVAIREDGEARHGRVLGLVNHGRHVLRGGV
jgi:hypothetical protein